MQAQVQQFLNVISNVQNTPPQHANDALAHIRKLYSEMPDQQAYNFVLFKAADHIMKLKSFNQQITWLVQQCIYDIISRSVESQFVVGAEALRCIFDANFDYYKHNNLDACLKYPLGLNRKLQWYEPEVGETVDVVKPYITSTSFCCWTRGILLSKDNKKYTVKYENTDTPVTNTSLPWFDVVGNRTKDHDWRVNLNVGDHIDAYNKFWYPSTVVESTVENGAKRVRVTFRRFNQNGQKVDAQGNRYDGLGINQDDWIDIFSYRIQRPNKMSHELCYYSYNCEQILIDDTYDLLFEKQYNEKPFWGIMRTNFTRSLSYLHFYNCFCDNNGYEIFIRKVKSKEIHIDNFIGLLMILGNTVFLVPRMAIKLYLPTILEISIQYIKENNKLLNPFRLDVFSYFVQSTAKRIYSLSQKHIILNNLRKYLSLEYLKLNLQKQMIALRFLVELIRPMRPYQTDAERKQLECFLIDNQIFYKIIQGNAHEQILSRSVDLLRFMITTNIIGWNQIQYIWNIIPHSDLRGRATIEKLIGDISKDFSLQYTSRIIDKLIAVKQTEITIDKLNLLRTLKDKALKMDSKVKILNYLWECLTIKSINIKQNVEQQIENVFRGFISTIKQSSLKLQVLKAILRRLKEINTVHNEMHLFKEFLLTYPLKVEDSSIEIEGDLPQTISQVIIYLKNQSIYDYLLKLLSLVKTKQKIESILQFIIFIFDKDKDDISSIVKSIYQLLGPSDEFLLWAKNLTSRAVKFFIQLYEDTSNMQKFQKISINGLQAIKTILLDMNQYEGNIKILKKRKTVMIGPALPPMSNSIGTSTSEYPNKSSNHQQTQNYSQRKVDNKQKNDKEEVLTFVYVLKSPFQCKGLPFLLQLLQYIKNNRVYGDIIKLIIQFIVNLDEKIIEKTQVFREEFLSRIISQISVIAQNNQLNDAIKLRLEIFVNLIEQLFCETQKQGLGSIRPHFSTIQGQIINLKIQNCITGNEINKKQPYSIEVNQNMTLWDLKVNLAAVYNQSPLHVDILKYVNPLEDTLNSKSMQQLHFFNEESIKIQKKSPKDIPRHDLLTTDNESLSQKFNQIVERWFKAYQNQMGYLSIIELTKLGTDQWKGSIFKEQNKLLQIINKYDQQKKGGLYLDEFKAFFIKKSVESNTAIWRMINLSGYRNNLKHKDEPQVQFDEKVYPRRILSNKVVYDTVFTILSSDVFQPIHLNFYKLLTMLETDHNLSKVVKSNIRQFLQNQKCIYRLSYGLQSLINELKNNLQLYGQFYQHDGPVQIASKLQNYFKDQTTSIYALDVLSKTVVIPNLLKILNLYVYPLISDHMLVRFVKKTKINHYDLEQLVKKIDKQQNHASEQLQNRQVLLSKNKPINLSEIFLLAQKILQNQIVNFKIDYLIKATFQISRLFGSLALVQPSFRPESILNGLKSQSINLRRICQSTIFLYLFRNKTPQFALLDKTIEQMPKQIKFSSSNHYFTLVTAILQKSIQVTKNNPQFDDYYKNLALRVIQIIWKTPNQIRGQNTVNRVLYGLFTIFYQIIIKKPRICKQLQYLKQQLIRKCLFFYNSQQKIKQAHISPQLLLSPAQPELFSDYIKCKADQTRKIVMQIVYQLYKQSDKDHSNFFDVFILPILRELPENTKKTSAKYLSVGLNNLGSTCYMNSMLQVLNSIDPLRNAIMMSNVESPLIRELKSLFSYLFFSERLDYVPKQLLSSFVPPINPGIQQDTTQFLNFLFDQIEQSLKNSPYKTLLQQIFKGNQVAQMICHSCGAKRQREEQFFTYSVQIEGKYDLHSALQGMHAGQLISDCLCESCGNRSDTTKRNVLNEVPNIFFVHLKRIVFNYDVFVNTKIHTRLYFPDELNFQPYTKEGVQLRQSLGVQYMKLLKDNEQQMKKFQVLALHGKQKKYYQLKLKGIIIHSGTPDVGHYYTIIKKESNWIKYDDSRASLFSSMSFDEECYGGSWVADEWGGFGSSKNAYVLVYEKEYKKDIVVESILDDQTVVRRPVPYSQFKTYNTQEWYKQVWLDNHSLMIEQHLTGEKFIKDFLGFVDKMLQLTPSVSTIEIISQIFYKISALSGEVGNLLQIFNKNIFLINKDILKKYVLGDGKKTFSLLFHYQQKVREFASEYIHQVLIFCYTDGSFETKQQIFKFMYEHLQMLNGEVAKNWLRIDGYFRLFQKLVQSSVNYSQIYQYFVNADLISYFIDFILQKSSPLNFIPKKYSLGTKSNPVNFTSGLNIIFFLFRKSYGLMGINYEIPEVSQNLKFHLTDNAIACLTSTFFYQKMIKQNQNREVISQLIQRMCIMNPDFSLAISRTLLKCFNQNTELMDQLETIMLCITKVLTIKDEFWQLRAEAILGNSTPFIYQANLMSSIEEQKYTYPSTLQNVFPLQSLLSYAHINRIRIPLTVLNMVKTILQSCSVSQQAMQYLLKQPSPSYIHLRYVDWLRPYVNQVINLLSLKDKKLQQTLSKISLCNLYLDDLDKVKRQMNTIVAGQICDRVLVKSFTVDLARVQINVYNVPVHGIQSLPNGHTNLVFQKYLTNGRLQTQVTADSNILKYFKQNSKPLAIKPKNTEQDQDKQLIGLFDQSPYPAVATAAVPMDIQPTEKAKPQPPTQVKQVQQLKQQPSVNKIPQQPVELKEVQLQGARVYPDYLRCLQIINKLQSNQLVIISLDQKKLPNTSNSTLPHILRILASKSKEEVWYTKTNPLLDWNELDSLIITVNDYVEPQKRILTRMYPSPFAQLQFPQYNNHDSDPQKQNQSANEANAVSNGEAANNFQQDFNQAEMNCPSCTLLNPISNSSCDVCGEPLHQS